MANLGFAWDDSRGLRHPRLPSGRALLELADALTAELGRTVPVASLVQDLSQYACWKLRPSSLFTQVPHMHMPPRLHRRWISDEERARIVARFGKRCLYCRQAGTIGRAPDGGPWVADHYLPKARGGSCHWLNLVAACRRCNDEKCDDLWLPGRRPTAWWRMTPMSKDLIRA
jgi:hypothetical protein